MCQRSSNAFNHAAQQCSFARSSRRNECREDIADARRVAKIKTKQGADYRARLPPETTRRQGGVPEVNVDWVE